MSERRIRSPFRGRARRRRTGSGPSGRPVDWADVVAEAPLRPISVGAADGSTTYIGRAPVFDRRLDVCGYHLVVDRLDDAGRAAGDAPRQLLTRALLEVGLDSLIGGRSGFVEVTVDLLAEGLHRALPAHRMFIEVTGPVEAGAEEVLRTVRDEGYPLIIGSLESCAEPDRVLPIATGLRVDVRTGDLDAAAEALAAHNPRGRLLATGLADSADVEPCRAAGATWLRGDVLRPAERIDEPTVPANRLAVLQLLSELERPDVDIDDIDALIAIDLGMSYKVLRMANSSYLALERRVERTRDAVVYLGIDTVRAVAALLALSEATDHPPEIVHQSLLRARHCEEILQLTHPSAAHAGFTTGLFSSLDLLLGLSVDQVLHRIPVSDEISHALRSRQGLLGRTLDVVIAYERHDLERLARGTIEPATVVSGYRNALAWVARITKGLEPAPA